MAVCTLGGEELAVGDAGHAFSMQAVCNAFTYALVSERRGRDAVHERVGVEPSGNPYNAIHLSPGSQRPFNPLGNAGAITVASLVPGADAAARLDSVLGFLGELAGGAPPRVDAAILAAELKAAERNRGIASLLRNFGVIEDEGAALDLYLQQCSIRVDCATLARMAACLAGVGVQPHTRRRVLGPATVRDTLSLMYTCGLHDGSGRFAYDVGVPAKSGISGGIVAVAPGRAGIAVWSPAVDGHGTSVRGVAALGTLVGELGWRVFSIADVREAPVEEP